VRIYDRRSLARFHTTTPLKVAAGTVAFLGNALCVSNSERLFIYGGPEFKLWATYSIEAMASVRLQAIDSTRLALQTSAMFLELDFGRMDWGNTITVVATAPKDKPKETVSMARPLEESVIQYEERVPVRSLYDRMAKLTNSTRRGLMSSVFTATETSRYVKFRPRLSMQILIRSAEIV